MAALLKPWTAVDAPKGSAFASKNSAFPVSGFCVLCREDRVLPVFSRDRALFVCRLKVQAFSNQPPALPLVRRVEFVFLHAAVCESDLELAVWVPRAFLDFVGPEFNRCSDSVNSGNRDLVGARSTRVNEEFAEIVDLTDLLFLNREVLLDHSESSGRRPQVVANMLSHLFFGHALSVKTSGGPTFGHLFLGRDSVDLPSHFVG